MANIIHGFQKGFWGIARDACVGDAFDHVEAEGGVGTCYGFDPTDPCWFPGLMLPRLEKLSGDFKSRLDG
jgi:hypothetical protein